jgi:hypothetical protein
MRRETVRSATPMSSLRSSPWMRGAPDKGFAVAIVLTSAAISVLTGGRLPRDRSERRVQYSRKRRRCHRRTVSGETMTSACRQPVQTLVRPAQNRRCRAEPRPGRRSLVDGELLAQGKVLEGELTVAADVERHESKQADAARLCRPAALALVDGQAAQQRPAAPRGR